MEVVKNLVSYNLRNANGQRLMLQYGKAYEGGRMSEKVEAQRWRFYGERIPMPVRSGTWFQGLSSTEMLDWLKREGWQPESRVAIGAGSALVYKVDFSDGNDDDNLKKAIRFLNDRNFAYATVVYRLLNGCDTGKAADAVREICNADN